MPTPEFPANLPDFLRRFRTEADCFHYIVALRWPEGFLCPGCGGEKAFARGDRLAFQCLSCTTYTTATAGTVTHHGRVEPQHLQAYLDEFVFRFNRRGNLQAAFQRLLGIATRGRALPAPRGPRRGGR